MSHSLFQKHPERFLLSTFFSFRELRVFIVEIPLHIQIFFFSICLPPLPFLFLLLFFLTINEMKPFPSHQASLLIFVLKDMVDGSFCSLTETEGCGHCRKVFESPLLYPLDAIVPAFLTLWCFVANVSYHSKQVKMNQKSYLQI